MRRPAPRSLRVFAAGAGALVLLSGCARVGQLSVLDPQGSRAQSVHNLWLLMFGIGAVVWLIVVIAMVVSIVRRRRADDGEQGSTGTPGGEDEGRRPLWFVAAAGAIIPGVIIIGVTAFSTVVQRDIDPDREGDGRVVEVIGHRYWWEVSYPEHDIESANEIHIPVGERVEVQLVTADVIHSLWVPELSGKVDMIPGRTNSLWLEADEPGTYWGQCAEFCGTQHAKMRFLVIAHEPAEFERWVGRQQEEAPFTPGLEEDAQVALGREVFMSSSCVYCHTIQGTAAAADVGPDLTHLASRKTLAAGILENNPGNLAGWILDPQSIKPGNAMPGTDLSGAELQALLAYLGSLE